MRALPYIQIPPRPKPGFFSRDAEFIVRGDYLTLANGGARLSVRILVVIAAPWPPGPRRPQVGALSRARVMQAMQTRRLASSNHP